MTRGGPLAGVSQTSRGYFEGPTQRGQPVTPTPIWGIGLAGNSLVYSEQFRSVHGTRRALYGSLNGAVNRLWRGRFKDEASRVHHAAWRRGGCLANRGAGAAGRADAAHRRVAKPDRGRSGRTGAVYGVRARTTAIGMGRRPQCADGRALGRGR